MKKIVNSKLLNHKLLLNEVMSNNGVKLSKVDKQILSCMLYDIPSYKNRGNKYITLTCDELFLFIYGENFNQSDKKQVTLKESIQESLDKLSCEYKSMYSKNKVSLLMKDGEGYTYNIHNCRSWNRMQQKFFPDLFTVNISHDDIFNNNNNLEAQLFVAYLAVILEDVNGSNRDSLLYNIGFRSSQVEEFFNIKKGKFDQTCKQIGLKIAPVFNNVDKKVVRKANLTKSNVSVASFFDNGSVATAKEFLSKHNVRINWINAFMTRMWFYLNNDQLTKSFFSDIQIVENYGIKSIPTTEDEFYKVSVNINCVNQKKLYYGIDVSDDTKAFNAEVQHRWNRDGKVYDEKNEELNKEKLEELKKQEYKNMINKYMTLGSTETHDNGTVDLEITEMLYEASKIKEFSEFCKTTQLIFQLCLKRAKKIDVAFDIKRILLNCLKDQKKTSFIQMLEMVNKKTDILSSVIFNEEFVSYSNLSNLSKALKIDLLELSLTRKDREKNQQSFDDEYFVTRTIDDYTKCYEEDLENYDKDDFIKYVLEVIGNKATESQIRKLKTASEDIDAKKRHFLWTKKQNMLTDQMELNHILVYHCGKKIYDTVECMMDEITDLGIRDADVNKYCRLFFNKYNIGSTFLDFCDVSEESFYSCKDVVEEYFNITLDKDIFNTNVSLLKDVCVRVVESPPSDELKSVKKEIIEAFKANSLEFGKQLDWDLLTEYLIDVEMGIRTIRDCINENLVSEGKKINFKGNDILESIKKSSVI